MTFSDDLKRFAAKVEKRSRDIFVGVANGVHESVRDGSAITTAPGQPVDTGNLKGSWIQAYPETWVGQTTTNVKYAPAIEEGVGPHGPMTLRSEVGGFHSVRQTRANFQALVDHTVREVVRD